MPGKRMLNEYGLQSQEWQIKSWEGREEQILRAPGVQIIHRGDLSCSRRSCLTVQLWDRRGAWYPSEVTVYDMNVLTFASIFPRSGFKCCLLTQSLPIPSETCASLRLTVTPNVSPPHYLPGRQQVFCDSEIRESWKDGAPPELDCLCRRRENPCFHFQSLSSRLSFPPDNSSTGSIHVCYMFTSVAWRPGLFLCTRGQRRRTQPPALSVCTFVLLVVGILVWLWSNDFVKGKTSWISLWHTFLRIAEEQRMKKE